MASAILASSTCTSFAKVTPEEAAQLKTVLTPFGAERAGNAAGTIPAWTGGLTQLPPGLVATDKMPDFHKDDKPTLTINAGNADQYSDHLSIGTLYMLKHYPGYKLVVYPTHRDASAPQWFYEATFKNATTAEIKDGLWVANAKSGIPFPIPKTGLEAIWNLNLIWYTVQGIGHGSAYVVAPGGVPLLNSTTLDQRWSPYTDPNYSGDAFKGYYLLAEENTIGPANRVGNQILAYESFDQNVSPQITWQYLVGQRRLRKAPQVTYDGAYPDCGGISTVDENSLFNGAPDRYNFRIVGKKEIYVPYDNNGLGFHTTTEVLQPNFVNPDLVRWELHRVWIIDLTLAPGKRHLLPHRRIYLDEDTWQATTSEDYDTNGVLAKIGLAFTYTAPAFPGVFESTNMLYETRGSGYCIRFLVSADHPAERALIPVKPAFPASFFSPNTIAAESVR